MRGYVAVIVAVCVCLCIGAFAFAQDSRLETYAWGHFQFTYPDEWEVVCPFEGADWIGELHLRRRLGRQSLLLDFNLLMGLLQPTLAEAARRIEAPIAAAQ